MPDLGSTHVAFTVRDLDASLAFYAKYAGMTVVHRCAHDGIRSAWLTDHTRPFVIVLVEGAGDPDRPLGPFGHLGVACKSREEIDRLYAGACTEGRPTRVPIDAGEPVSRADPETRRAAALAVIDAARIVRSSAYPTRSGAKR